MKIAAQSGAMTRLGWLALTACMSPLFLQAAVPPACPTTAGQNAVFSGATLCAETDNYWFEFTDLDGTTLGNSLGVNTALPTNTNFHIDSVIPGNIAITIEPGGPAQFATGDTYGLMFDVVEDAAGNVPFGGVSASYDTTGGNFELQTTVTGLNVNYSPFNLSNPASSVTALSQLAQLTLMNGALQMAGTGTVDGLQYVDVISGIGSATTIQSISNDAEEAPEPQAVVLLGLGLPFMFLIRRSLIRA